jgi:hypothetical protein
LLGESKAPATPTLEAKMKKIKIKSDKYPNIYTLVDDEDYDYLNQWTWNVSKGKLDTLYVVRIKCGKTRKDQKTISMHRTIMNFPKDKVVDHIDHNALNNQKSNLRICTQTQNKRNSRKRNKCKSSYKGVYCRNQKEKRNKLWVARINVNNNVIYIGGYKTEKEAAIAYNEAAKKYFGEFAYLNVI